MPDLYSFTFVGFISRSGPERLAAVQSILLRQDASVLFESPHRVRDTLQELFEQSKRLEVEATVFIGRELTKRYEDTFNGSLEQVGREQSLTRPES